MTDDPEQKLTDPIQSVLQSDLALEIRAEFEGRRSVGLDVPATTRYVIDRFHATLTSPTEGPVLLIALAALQMREQYLQPVIRNAALDLIQSDEALNAYRSQDFAQRKATGQVLEQLAEMLQSFPLEEES